MRFVHPDGDYSWLAQHDKTYDEYSEAVESNTYVFDTNPDNEITGVGEIRFARSSDDPYFKDKLFVGWTKTELGFERQGLGRRRLLVMNMVSHALYGCALHSDTLLSEPAQRLWEGLVDESAASRYNEVARCAYPR